MKEIFNELSLSKAATEHRLKMINTAIEALQNLCAHDYKIDVSDSHYDFEKCIICGKIEKT